MINIDFPAGCHIDQAALRLCEAAAAHGEATGMFNDIELHAAAGYSPVGIVAYFNEESERRQEAYRNSLEGKRPAHVLEWLCQMQECSDHVGVIVRRSTIVGALERAGYKANENTGKDYKDGDRENMCRYIIGQAFDGLTNGPSIHPIIHKFANEWRERFNA